MERQVRVALYSSGVDDRCLLLLGACLQRASSRSESAITLESRAETTLFIEALYAGTGAPLRVYFSMLHGEVPYAASRELLLKRVDVVVVMKGDECATSLPVLHVEDADDLLRQLRGLTNVGREGPPPPEVTFRSVSSGEFLAREGLLAHYGSPPWHSVGPVEARRVVRERSRPRCAGAGGPLHSARAGVLRWRVRLAEPR